MERTAEARVAREQKRAAEQEEAARCNHNHEQHDGDHSHDNDHESWASQIKASISCFGHARMFSKQQIS